LEKFLNWSVKNRTDSLLCCGDMTNEDTMNHLLAEFSGPIYLARGNADSFNLKDTKLTELNRSGGIINITGIKIGLCHEPKNIGALAEQQPDYIFYGHTHKPHMEKSGMSIIANPGTLGGWQYPSSFASLDTETMELQLIIADEIK
jgi:putative phosphoesterase